MFLAGRSAEKSEAQVRKFKIPTQEELCQSAGGRSAYVCVTSVTCVLHMWPVCDICGQCFSVLSVYILVCWCEHMRCWKNKCRMLAGHRGTLWMLTVHYDALWMILQQLDKSEAPNYLSVCVPPSKFPTRHFCAVCGYPCLTSISKDMIQFNSRRTVV